MNELNEEQLKAEIEKQVSFYHAKYYGNPSSIMAIGVKFELTGNTAGRAYFYGKIRPSMIDFNLEIAMVNQSEFLTRTVPHEVAHIIDGEINGRTHGHGVEWKMVMETLEVEDITRCHNYDLSEVPSVIKRHPYRYKCGECEKEYQVSEKIHSEIQRGSRRCACGCKNLILIGSPDDEWK